MSNAEIISFLEHIPSKICEISLQKINNIIMSLSMQMFMKF